MKRIVLGLGLLLSLAPTVKAQVTAAPSLLNFQGRLAAPSGNPIPDGTYSIRFSLWTAATAGTEKWNQTIANVAVKNGTFAVLLSGFSATAFDGDGWLETKIGTDAPLAPRQRLVSVPYALKANAALTANVALTVPDNSITSAKIANGTITSLDLASDPSSINYVSGGHLSMSNGNLIVGRSLEVSNDLTVTDDFAVNGMTRIGADSDYGTSTVASFAPGTIFFDAPGVIGGRLTILGSNGNVGIGTTAPAQKLDVNGAVKMTGFQLGNAAVAGQVLTADGSGGGTWQYPSTYPWTLSGTDIYNLNVGKIGIGTATPQTLLDVAGTVSIRGNLFADNAQLFQGGLVTSSPDANSYALRAAGKAGGTTGWNQSSDVRFKTHIAPLPNALETILALRGVSFDWRHREFPTKNFSTSRDIGFIAQEIEQVLPQVVSADEQGYKSVAYGNVVPVLVEAMKQQKHETDARLKVKDAEIAELRAQVAVLADAVAKLQKNAK